MMIVCDRCKMQYDADDDTIINVKKDPRSGVGYNAKKEYHICPLCKLKVIGFVEEKIDLKKQTVVEKDKEELDKIYSDYFESLDYLSEYGGRP